MFGWDLVLAWWNAWLGLVLAWGDADAIAG